MPLKVKVENLELVESVYEPTPPLAPHLFGFVVFNYKDFAHETIVQEGVNISVNMYSFLL
jgi:hypothetical protein